MRRAGVLLAVVAVVTLLPGLGGLRSRLAHATPEWLVLGVVLKLLSGLGYVAVFRMIFCRRMRWRVSTQIGMSELGANALFPTGVDAGLVGTLVLYHVSITSAAGAVLLYRAIALWVPALAGSAAFVALRRTLRDEAEQLAVCGPQTEIEIIGLGRAVIHGEAVTSAGARRR